MGSVTILPKSLPINSAASKMEDFSGRTTAAQQLKVWVGITVALFTLCLLATYGHVLLSVRASDPSTGARVTAGLECGRSYLCHGNMCFMHPRAL